MNNRTVKRFWDSRMFGIIDKCVTNVNPQHLNQILRFNVLVKEKYYKNEDWYFINVVTHVDTWLSGNITFPTRSGKIIISETDINHFIECVENKELRDKLYIMLKLQYGPRYYLCVGFIEKLYKSIAAHREQNDLMGT